MSKYGPTSRHRQRAKPQELSHVELRCLVAIIDMKHFGELPTVRGLMRRLGYSEKSPGAVMEIVHRLKDRGLVGWESGKQATLTPTCSLLMIDNPPEAS